MQIPSVVAWLLVHAEHCDQSAACPLCALSRTRKQVLEGAGRERPQLATSRGLVSPVFVDGQHDVVEFVDKFLTRVHELECDAGRCAMWGNVQNERPVATHVDRLFGFVRETRRRCKVCELPVVRSWFSRETFWRLYPEHVEGGPQTVLEM